MRLEERESILRESAPRAETARERRQLAGLEDDLSSSPLRGAPLPIQLRNFAPSAEGYLASLGGPLPYMQRLREIQRLTELHQHALATERERCVAELAPREVAETWRAIVSRWRFDEVNDLISRHNRWYPVEARLPMDPKRGDFALVNGRDYRLSPLDAAWALARFPG